MEDKYFILNDKYEPVEKSEEAYSNWEKKGIKIDQSFQIPDSNDQLELEFMGGNCNRDNDLKLFRVSYYFSTNELRGYDRIIDEDYATYEDALERFNDFIVNGRKTSIVFKKEWEKGLHIK